ncbi:MAG: chloride channel protein [Paraclostridium bifermentans]|uniref:chloride channel protein n=1 Tax=Paraclostridium bifermentans TaxID=1490 RepID=UPI001D5956C5|nr:chloride channel protein [Paraclostridium bifermentans]MBS6507887.1 chloride channel protein [Paraclostridium bifermentans]
MEQKVVKLDLALMFNSALMGAFVGILTWTFLGIVNVGTHFIWHTLKDFLNIKYWTLIVASIGGILVGITQKHFGEYPKYMDQTLEEFKKNKRVEYKSLKNSIINSLTILFFGASVGPEAALSGIAGGIITFVGDKMKERFKKKNVVNQYSDELIEYSMQVSAGLVFRAPLFGIYTLSEKSSENRHIIKKIKVIVYTVTTIAGFLVFVLLSKFDNRPSFIVKFGQSNIGLKEIIWFIPLIIIAMLLAYIYKMYALGLHRILKPIENKKILKGIIGGLGIGILGTIFPWILFSGEHGLRELVVEWNNISAYMLILLSLVKLLLTEICLSTGHRGGHIFPLIFSGSCLAYGVSKLFSIDPIFCLAIIVTGLASKAIGNMFVAIFLLIFFFPINTILPMVLAAAIGKMINDIETKLVHRNQSIKK